MGGMIKLTAADGHEFDAYKATPSGTPKGGICVIQEIFGANAHIKEVADGYAADGYLAIAPALYDRAERGVDLSYSPEDMQAGRDFRAGCAIGVVTGTNAGASACLDQYAVTATGQLRNRIRNEADTRFTNFDFLWNTDKHDFSPDTRNDRTCGKDRCSACPLSGPEFMALFSGSTSRRTTLEQQMSSRQPILETIC